MKNLTLFICIFTFGLLTQTASADSYWGLKATSASVNDSAYSDSVNLGVFVGADINKVGSAPIAVEGEITGTAVAGEVSSVDWTILTAAVYAAMRTGDDDYFKIKVGYLDSSLEASGSTNKDYSGLSYGIGFGFSNVEIEYTLTNGKNSSDLSMISVAYLF